MPNISKEQKISDQKAKAIEIMKELDIYNPYIKAFEKKGEVCLFEGFGGYWASQYPELIEKKKEIEEKYNCVVYAITHEMTEFGKLYSFLLVTNHKSEWGFMYDKPIPGNESYVYAYVWNKTEDLYSEFGTIAVKSFGGGIVRCL